MFAAILPIVAAHAQTTPGSPAPTDAEIRKILADRIEIARQSVGMVAGVIDPQGRRVVSYGSLDKDDKRPLNGDTIFEIGSITKVFTSLVLADMVQRGEVALTDSIAKYLPREVKVPERGGKSITLQDLSTQVSGLPRLPSNLAPKDATNPYADYSAENLYQFLSGYTLPRDIGEKWEYSNLGIGLLGHVLSLRAGMDYEGLVQSRIGTPLGMNNTRITLSPEMKSRLAVGHNAKLAPVPNWDFQALAGAGALRSSAVDLLTFLAANLGYTESPLAKAMAAMPKIRQPTGVPGLDNALGWQVTSRAGKEIVWKDGGTFGYSTFIGYDANTRTGVVVLSNTFTLAGVNDIGLHLLDPSSPLMKPQPPKEHKEITLDPKRFDGLVGRYQLAPAFVMTITREASQFFVQATGQPRLEVFAESERDFFVKVVDARITFETDTQGHGTVLILHQNGLDQRAKRVE
jgi:CubicO group peptidase (beta-lactamase class C family)